MVAEKKTLETWIKIGKANPWIAQVGSGNPDHIAAFEEPFGDRYFAEAESLKDLYQKLTETRWCLGQAFYFENFCFINQIDGGDEWLTIRDDIAFESITAHLFSFEEFKSDFESWKKATPAQLKSLQY